MDINLGYIEGISYIDTPYFENATQQANYFLSKLVKVIVSTFYPPHYRNKIRFEVDDIDFDSQVNYLWFEFNDKVYYYFIDKLTYVNESVIELDIVLDVIQTFMFNITITNGVIERKFINRWNNNLINRNYLRENVSSGLFTEQATTLINRNLWLVVKRSIESSIDLTTCVTINGKKSYLPYALFYIPLFCTQVVYEMYDTVGSTSHHTVTENIDYTKLTPLLKDNNILDAYIIDYNPRPNDFSISGTTWTINNYIKPYDMSAMLPGDVNYLIFTYSYLACCLDWHYTYDSRRAITNISSLYSYSLLSVVDPTLLDSYVKNIMIATAFSSLYMPVLLDENYIRIEYGNGGGIATYPMYKITSISTIGLYEYYNIDEGSKIFSISETNKALYDGLDYLSFTYSNINPNMTLLNDAWTQYKANNKGRWVAAGIGTLKNAITSFIGIPSKNAYINNKIASLLADPNRLDKRYKMPTLKETYNHRLFDLNTKKRDLTGEVIKGAMDTSNDLIGQGIADMNAYFAPDSIRQSGDFISSFISTQMLTFYRKLMVNDYTQCAYYYHKNGYKVDEHVNNIANIFSYVKNRYYFNILKMRDCDLHLTNYIENNDDIDAIKDRLMDGVRLWNVSNRDKIGDFTFDNVETDYLS